MSSPKPSKTPTTTRQEILRVSKITTSEINRVLARIGLRLDQVDAIGQDKDMKGRRVVNVGNAVQDRDAVPLKQVRDLSDTNFTHYWRPMLIGYGGMGHG